MDCTKFEATVLDALYGELDEVTTAAVTRHAAGCASCAAQLTQLRATRRLIRLEPAPLPDGLEARILAAAEAAMPPVASGSREAGGAPASGAGGLPPARGPFARVLRLLTTPQMAIAASFLLIVGAAWFFGRQGASAPTDKVSVAGRPAAGEAPAAVASASVAYATESDKDGRRADEQSDERTKPHDSPAETKNLEKGRGEPTVAMVPPPAPPPAAAPLSQTLNDVPRNAGPLGGAPQGNVSRGRRLYEEGRYADALQELDQAGRADADAELYAALSMLRLNGCAQAAPRLDALARRAAGTSAGSRAQLEAARCYRGMGDAQGARQRYAGLLNDNYVGEIARRESQQAAPGQEGPQAQRPAGPPKPATTATATATATAAPPATASAPQERR